jgi:predicted dehydrogenase
MSESKPVGVGIIGTGGYANGLARAVKESSRLRLVHCYDPREDVAVAFAEKYGSKASSLSELLSDDAVEGVVVASPNSAHRENAVAAAEAGKHVFVDKPIANEIHDAVAIIEACKARDLVLSVGHNTRRADGHRQMKSMISAGDIGRPVMAEANFSRGTGLKLTGSEWRSSREGCPALPLMQLGVHFADTLQYLLGDITEVTSFMTRLMTPVDNDDVTVSILKFGDGQLGYLGSNYLSARVFYVNVFGTHGNLYCENGNELKLLKADEDAYRDIQTISRYSQLEELEEFADCIRFGNRPEVDGEAALKALAVVRAAMEADRLGRTVKMSEILP